MGVQSYSSFQIRIVGHGDLGCISNVAHGEELKITPFAMIHHQMIQQQGGTTNSVQPELSIICDLYIGRYKCKLCYILVLNTLVLRACVTVNLSVLAAISLELWIFHRRWTSRLRKACYLTNTMGGRDKCLLKL